MKEFKDKVAQLREVDMGLAVRMEKGNYYPILICESCDQAITDWHRAIAAHDMSKGEGIGPIRVYHKGDCDPGRVGHREKQASGWFELRHYLAWLLWNNGWGEKSGDLAKDEAKLTIDVPGPL